MTNTTHYGSIKITKDKGSEVMYNVVKISEDKIYMLNDEGKMFKTDLANANWNVQVGDVITIHNVEGKIVLSQVNKTIVDNKKKKKNFSGIVKACKKVLIPIFSALFAISLIAFFVFTFIPHGKRYTYSIEKENGDFAKIEITFRKNEVKIHLNCFETIEYTLTNPGNENYSEAETYNKYEREYFTVNYKYKIHKKQLYVFNPNGGESIACGEISSTNIVFEIPESDEINITYFLEENTMKTLKTLSLILFISFAVLDMTCIAVAIIGKINSKKTEQLTLAGANKMNNNLDENTTTNN